jgi:uncharacterized membrane protein
MLAKPANRYLRWNLLFTFFILFFLTCPIWLTVIPAVRNFSMEIVVIIVIILNLLWLVAIINALRLLYRLRRYRGHLPTIGDNQESLKSSALLISVEIKFNSQFI